VPRPRKSDESCGKRTTSLRIHEELDGLRGWYPHHRSRAPTSGRGGLLAAGAHAHLQRRRRRRGFQFPAAGGSDGCRGERRPRRCILAARHRIRMWRSIRDVLDRLSRACVHVRRDQRRPRQENDLAGRAPNGEGLRPCLLDHVPAFGLRSRCDPVGTPSRVPSLPASSSTSR